MTGRLAFVAVTAVLLGPMSACSGAKGPTTRRDRAHALVSYRREGGIRFQYSALTVSTRGDAAVRANGCTATTFRLSASLWRRLKTTLKRTDVHALKGDYPPPPGAADVTAQTIVVGRDTVRIGDFTSLPEKVRRELRPLIDVLGEIVGAGERRMPSRCRGGRTAEGPA